MNASPRRSRRAIATALRLACAVCAFSAFCAVSTVSALPDAAARSASEDGAQVLVVAGTVSGWGLVPFEPPDLSQSPQLALVDWRAWSAGPSGAAPRFAGPAARLVVGCFSTPTQTWTPEAEPIALAKIAQVASGTALRLTQMGGVGGVTAPGTERTEREGLVVSQRLAGSSAEARVAIRTFLGFEPDLLVACFAMCVDPVGVDAPRCEAAVDEARLVGPLVSPPPTGPGLALTMAGVHHPRTSAGILAALVALGAALAVVTRKRPRSR